MRFILALFFLFFLSCKKIDFVQLSTSTIVSNIYQNIKVDSNSKTRFIYKPTAFQSTNGLKRGYQGVPAIGYNDGIIYVAWMAGHANEEKGNYIVVVSSLDKGFSWSQELILAPTIDSFRCIDPMFWNEPNGNLRLGWTTTAYYFDGGVSGAWSIGIKATNSNCLITKPYRMFDGVSNVKPLFRDSKPNEILFPVSGWTLTSGQFPNSVSVPTSIAGPRIYSFNFNYINGQSYISSSFISKISTKNYPRDYDEHIIAEQGKDTLNCLLRSSSLGFYSSTSFDAGNTWTQAIPFTKVGNTTSSRVFYGKLNSGNMLLVLNSSKKRDSLAAFLSKDLGRTWPYKLPIFNPLSSYPDVAQDEQGNILLVFDQNRYPYGRIYFTKFTENDVISGISSSIKLSFVSKIK